MAVPNVSNQNNGVNVQDFLRLLVTQLTQQDPLKPMDNEQFLAQMAQFTSLQQTQQINENISQLLLTQLSSQSISLLNRTVDIGTGSNGQAQAGVVKGVTFNQGQPLLSVQVGQQLLSNISLSQVIAIR